ENLMLGATYRGANQCQFVVWAPFTDRVQVRILDRSPGLWRVSARGHNAGPNHIRLISLTMLALGYHSAVADRHCHGYTVFLLPRLQGAPGCCLSLPGRRCPRTLSGDRAGSS